MNVNMCIALNSKQCMWVAFNLNASFELDASSIPYLASISKIQKYFDLNASDGAHIDTI